MNTIIKLLFCFIVPAGIILCIELVPERSYVTYVDTNYVKYANTTVMRYSRRSKYVLNIDGEILHSWGNNVTLNLIFYEYLHNEYRRSFVEMHFKLCDMIKNDTFVGRAFRNINLACPFKPGKMQIRNISFPLDDFPNVFPFDRCRVDVELVITNNKHLMGSGELYLKFIDNHLKNTKKITTKTAKMYTNS